MLSRSQRLSGEQLEEVLKKGKVIHTPFFWIRLYKQPGIARVAVLSPQKLLKTAVLRNRFRRKIYEIIGSFKKEMAKDYHLVVCMKEPILKADKDAMQEKTREIFVKAGVLK